uniref:G_PROTEIN_RECEP_F1_2 domain-containing protein n=1 Tax=Steinernema glaseri TaxID=37863 RepID=A0A1I7Y1F9_9BILA
MPKKVDSNRKETVGDMDDGLLTRFDLYMGFGVFAVLTNVLVLIVLWSRKEMRTTLVLFQALAFSDLINGVSYIFAGAVRRHSVESGRFHDYIHPMDCAKAIFPAFLILGGLLPAFMNFMLSLERLIAIQFIAFYKRSCNFTGKIVLALVVWIVGMFMMNDSSTVLRSRMCDVLKASGKKYGITHFALVSVLFFVSFVLLVIVAFMANQKKVDDNMATRLLLLVLLRRVLASSVTRNKTCYSTRIVPWLNPT